MRQRDVVRRVEADLLIAAARACMPVPLDAVVTALVRSLSVALLDLPLRLRLETLTCVYVLDARQASHAGGPLRLGLPGTDIR